MSSDKTLFEKFKTRFDHEVVHLMKIQDYQSKLQTKVKLFTIEIMVQGKLKSKNPQRLIPFINTYVI